MVAVVEVVAPAAAAAAVGVGVAAVLAALGGPAAL